MIWKTNINLDRENNNKVFKISRKYRDNNRIKYTKRIIDNVSWYVLVAHIGAHLLANSIQAISGAIIPTIIGVMRVNQIMLIEVTTTWNEKSNLEKPCRNH